MATSPAPRAPVVTSKATVKYLENDAPKLVASALTITDTDSTMLTGATVKIAKGFAAGQDMLGFTLQGGISGSYNAATGVLTLSGTASLADYQAVLRSVTYANTSESPTVAQRQVDIVVSDGTNLSKAVSSKVSVVPANDLPTLGGLDNLVYTQLLTGASLALDANVTIGDLDSPQLSGMTVQITGGYIKNEDFLQSYEMLRGVTAKWNATTGTLTYTGKATLAQYEEMLQAVRYLNDEGADAHLGPRTVTVKFNDGKGLVTVGTMNIIFATPPVLTGDGGATSYVENAAAVAIDGSLAISDLDDTSLESATVRIAANFQAGDTLGFANTASITGSYNAGTGVLTLTGTASIADYQAAIRSVTFSSTNDNPGAGKTIEYVVNDGQANSNAVTKTLNTTPVNDAPALMLAGTVDTSLGYTENGAATQIAPAATLADPDSPNFDTGTLTVAFAAGGTSDDQLAIGSIGSVGTVGADVMFGATMIGTYTGGTNGSSLVVTFNAASTPASVQAVVRAITFSNASDNPSGVTRNVTFTLTDGDGGTDAGLPDATINFTVVNDVPVVTVTSGEAAYTEGGAAVAVDAAVAVTDADDTSLEGATVSITGSLQAGDLLAFTGSATITGSYDAGVLTLTGTDTVAAYQAALQSITFSTTNDDPAASRTIEFVTTDGDGNSVAVTRTIAVTPVNDAPVIDAQSAVLGYTENDAATVIAPATTVSDADSANFGGGSLTVGLAADAAEDQLAIRNQGTEPGEIGVDGADVTYGGVVIGTFTGGASGADLVVTFNTSATQAAAAALAQNITYANTSDDPSTAARTVTFTLVDGDGTALGGDENGETTATVNVTAVNDAPTVVSSTGNVGYVEGSDAVVVDASLALDDVDDTNLESATFTITGNFQAGDVLSFADTQTITASYDDANGILTLTGTDTEANYQAALRSVTFSTTNDDPAATRTIEWTVYDGAADSNTGTRTIDVTPVNDAPVPVSGATLGYTENGAAAAIDTAATVSDPDSADFGGGLLAVRFSENGTSADQLSVLNQGTGSGQVGSSAGTISYEGVTIGTATGGTNGTELNIALTGNATQEAVQALMRAIAYANTSDDPSTASRTVEFEVVDGDGTLVGGDEDGFAYATINVTAVNDDPVVTASAGTAAYTEGGAAATVDGAITLTVTDVDDTDMEGATVSISSNFQLGDSLNFAGLGNITGSYSSLTGVLTLSGTDTEANYQLALRSVTFSTTNDNPTTTKTVQWLVNDGDDNSAPVTRGITITPVNDAPVLTLGPAALVYTENAAPTAIAPGATITDVDSLNFVNGSLEINFNSGSTLDDRLTVMHQGNGAGQIGVNGSIISYEGVAIAEVETESAHGIGTSLMVHRFTSAATIEAVQALVRAIGYSNVSENPTTTTRNILFIVTDDAGDPAFAPATVDITRVNDAPTATGSGGTTAYTEQAASVAVDAGITVSDPDDANLEGARVSVAGYEIGEDTLAFNTYGNITGSWNGTTGVLTLSGTDTVENYEAALRTVRYSSFDNTPAATKTIEWYVNDGDTNSNTTSKTIAIAPVNDAPIVIPSGAAPTYNEGAAPAVISSAAFTVDLDSSDFNGGSLTVSVTGNATSNDELGIRNQGTGAGEIGTSGANVTYGGVTIGTFTGGTNSAPLVITFNSGAATQAAGSALVRNITFANQEIPSSVTKTVTFTLNDGDGGTSAGATATVNAVAVNDAPVVTTSGGNTGFTEAGAAVAIDASLLLTDIDSPTASGATVQVTSGYILGEDLLAFSGNGSTGDIAVNGWNPGTGTLQLESPSGTATIVQWEAALRLVTFDSTSTTPGASRAITFQVNDGDGGSNLSTPQVKNIAITEINSAPQLGVAGSASFVEDAGAVLVHATITVGDPDSPTLVGATVSITGNFTSGQDVLAFGNTGTISGSYNPGTGVLVLTGTDTLENYQAALRSITYENTSNTPVTAARTVTFEVNDGQGLSNMSNMVTSTVSVAASNDAPTITGAGATLAYTEDAAALAIDSSLGLADPEGDSITGATVSIAGMGFGGEDILAFTENAGDNISGSYNPGTGVLTFTGTDTLANYEALLETVTYRNNSNTPSTGNRTITWSITDPGALSGSATSTVTVATVNDAPVLAGGAGGALAYTENSAATTINGGLTVSDVDSATMAGATVSITSNFTNGQDVLTFANVGPVTGSYNAGTGVLTVSGTGTRAEYQAFLQGVGYQNTSDNPSTATRTISFQANDGSGVNNLSNVVTRDVSVTPVNDAPTSVASGGTTAYTEQTGSPAVDAAIALADVDDANLEGATVSITTGFQSGDALVFTNTGNITGSYVAGTGVLTLSGSDTVANYQAALRSIQFTSTSDTPATTKVVTFVVNDGTAPSVATTKTVAVTAVNDAPDISTAGASLTYTENQAAQFIAPSSTVVDVDSLDMAGGSLTVSFSANGTADDRLALFLSGTGPGQFTITSGALRYEGDFIGVLSGGTGTTPLVISFEQGGDPSPAAVQALMRNIQYSNVSDNPSTAARTVTFTVVDGDGGTQTDTATATVNVLAVNDAPTIADAGATATYTENGAPVAIDTSLTLGDVEGNSITGATVAITGNFSAGDALAFTPQSGITGNFSGTTLTLSGTATLAQYEAALESVTFATAGDDPSALARTVTWTVTDNGTPVPLPSSGVTSTVNVTPVNDAPVNTVPANASLGTAMSNTNFAVGGISIADLDAAPANVQVQVVTTNGGSTLTLAGTASVTGGANGTGTVTIQGSIADVNTTLASLVFKSTDGFSGTATVQINTSDLGNEGTGGVLTDSDTISIGVIPQVFIIDNTGGGTGGNGSAATPFKTIADFSASTADGAGDYIYLKTGSGTYTENDGFELLANQQVHGQGQTLQFTNPVTGEVVTIGTAGATPTVALTSSVATNTGVTLASGNTLTGLNFTTAVAGQTAIVDGAGTVGTLTISQVNVSGSGAAFDVDQGGALNVAFGTLSSSGGANNVQLSGGLTGTFSASSGALSGATTAAFQIGDGGTANAGGTVNVSYGGTVSATGTARTIDIQDRVAAPAPAPASSISFTNTVSHASGNGSTIFIDDIAGGSISFGASATLNSGTQTPLVISDLAAGVTVGFSNSLDVDGTAGIAITGNAGAVTFSSSLDIDTTTGAGIDISGNSGSVSFTGSQVSVNTTTGTGVSVAGTGSTTFNLTGDDLDIITNGGSGFVASNGALGGTVTVAGDSNTISSTNGTGLSVTNTNIGAGDLNFVSISSSGAASGIVLNNTGTAGSLNVVGTGNVATGGSISNTTGAGIVLTNTTDVNLNWMQVINTGTHGIIATNLGGAANKIWDSFITDFGNGNDDDGLHLVNNNTHGTLSLDDTDFTGASGGNDAIFIEGQGNSNLTVTINSGNFTGLYGDGIQAQTIGGATGTVNVNVTNNSFTNAVTLGNGGVSMLPANGTGTFNGTISGNTFSNILKTTGVLGHVNLTTGAVAGPGPTTNFVVANNTISGNTTNHNGIFYVADGFAGPSNLTVTGNTINNLNWSALTIGARDNATDVDVIISGNSIGVTSGGNIASGVDSAVVIEAQNSGRIDVQMTGNTIRDQADFESVFVSTVDAGSIVNLTTIGNNIDNSGPSNLEMSMFALLGTINYLATSTPNVLQSGTGTILLDEAPGATINITNASLAAFAAAHGIPTGNVLTSGEAYNVNPPPALPTIPLMAASAAGGVAAGLTTDDALPGFVEAAIWRWEAAGATAEQLAAMRAVTFAVADLEGLQLGLSETGLITLDINAAGHGWFVDRTMWDDSEFGGAGPELQAHAGSLAEGRMDLLTAVMHELGHQAGLPDMHALPSEHAMSGLLDAGERHLPVLLVGAGTADLLASGA